MSSRLFIIDFKSSLSLIFKSRQWLFCAGDSVLFGWRDTTSSFLSSGEEEAERGKIMFYRSARGHVCNQSLVWYERSRWCWGSHVDVCSGLKCISHKINVNLWWVLMTSVIITNLKCRIQSITLPAACISHQISRRPRKIQSNQAKLIKYRPTLFICTFSADCGRQYAEFNTF